VYVVYSLESGPLKWLGVAGSSCKLLIVPLFRGSSRFESLIYHTIQGLHESVMKRILMMMMRQAEVEDMLIDDLVYEP